MRQITDDFKMLSEFDHSLLYFHLIKIVKVLFI